MNISIFNPLSGSAYIELPRRLRNSMKGLINIKRNNDKFSLWYHIRHLNPLKIHPKRIPKTDKNMVNDLDYKHIKCPVSKKILARLKRKIIFALLCFVMKIIWFILFIYQKKNLKIVWVYWWSQIKISHIKSKSKILTDLFAIRQKKEYKTLLQVVLTMI